MFREIVLHLDFQASFASGFGFSLCLKDQVTFCATVLNLLWQVKLEAVSGGDGQGEFQDFIFATQALL